MCIILGDLSKILEEIRID